MGFVSCQRSKFDSTFLFRKRISPLETTRNKLRFPSNNLHQHAGSFKLSNLRAFDDTVDVIDVLLSEEGKGMLDFRFVYPNIICSLFKFSERKQQCVSCSFIPCTFISVQTTFEPQVNTPALFSFLFIVVTYSLLQLRINGVRLVTIFILTDHRNKLKNNSHIESLFIFNPNNNVSIHLYNTMLFTYTPTSMFVFGT